MSRFNQAPITGKLAEQDNQPSRRSNLHTIAAITAGGAALATILTGCGGSTSAQELINHSPAATSPAKGGEAAPSEAGSASLKSNLCNVFSKADWLKIVGPVPASQGIPTSDPDSKPSVCDLYDSKDYKSGLANFFYAVADGGAAWGGGTATSDLENNVVIQTLPNNGKTSPGDYTANGNGEHQISSIDGRNAYVVPNGTSTGNPDTYITLSNKDDLVISLQTGGNLSDSGILDQERQIATLVSQDGLTGN